MRCLCGVKCSHQCDPFVFCVCFFSEMQVQDPRSACAGVSKCAYECTGEEVLTWYCATLTLDVYLVIVVCDSAVTQDAILDACEMQIWIHARCQRHMYNVKCEMYIM